MDQRFEFCRNEMNLDLRYDRTINREIETSPFRILDAPGILEKECLLDWQNSLLTIALHDCAYIYNTNTKSSKEICSSSGYISCLKLNENLLISGDSLGNLVVSDIKENKKVVNKQFQTQINSLEIKNQSLVFCTKNTVNYFDLRANEVYKTFNSKESVFLKYSRDKRFLGISGDGITIFSEQSDIPYYHNSIVSRCIDWCNWRNGILAVSPYRTNTLKIIDIIDGREDKDVKLNARVTALKFVNQTRELLICTGKTERDEGGEISLYRANSLKIVSKFGRHDAPIFNVCNSGDESIVCTVACDESLKFWKIFDKEKRVRRDSTDIRL